MKELFNEKVKKTLRHRLYDIDHNKMNCVNNSIKNEGAVFGMEAEFQCCGYAENPTKERPLFSKIKQTNNRSRARGI